VLLSEKNQLQSEKNALELEKLGIKNELSLKSAQVAKAKSSGGGTPVVAPTPSKNCTPEVNAAKANIKKKAIEESIRQLEEKLQHVMER